MLADPIAVTYNAAAQSLPRTGLILPGVKSVVSRSGFNTPDREFECFTQASLLADGSRKTEITLCRTTPDTDPFNGGGFTPLRNGFGFHYIMAPLGYYGTVDIPRLRTALNTFVSGAIELRIMNGEM